MCRTRRYRGSWCPSVDLLMGYCLKLPSLRVCSCCNWVRGLMLIIWTLSLLQLLITHRICAKESDPSLVVNGAMASMRSWKPRGSIRLAKAVLKVWMVVEDSWLMGVLVWQIIGAHMAPWGSCRLNRWISSIYMIVNRILNSTKTEPSVKNSSAVFFVSLTKARVLMELRQYLVESWYWMMGWQIL